MTSAAQINQQILEKLNEIMGSMRTSISAVYDDTRVYEYGVDIRIGLGEDQSPTKIINDMRDWCNNTFGPKPYGEYYGDRWMVSNNTFWFKNERDRTLFLLQFAR